MPDLAGSLGLGETPMIDWEVAKVWLVVVALIAFNLPIAVAGWKFRKLTGLSEILDGQAPEAERKAEAKSLRGMIEEKTPNGTPTGAISYSRVTGLIGAVVVASLFWIMSNISIAVAILNPEDLTDILGGITKLFLVGAALFLPYAFNQLKTLIQ